MAAFATHPDFEPGAAFSSKDGGGQSVRQYKRVEDLNQIPYHEEMGEFNKTILRCSDAVFRINVAEMNTLKVATLKQMKEANRVMGLRN